MNRLITDASDTNGKCDPLWPTCTRCRDIVHAYGIADETATAIDVWARCHGETEHQRIIKDPTWDVHDAVAAIAGTRFFRGEFWRQWRTKAKR